MSGSAFNLPVMEAEYRDMPMIRFKNLVAGDCEDIDGNEWFIHSIYGNVIYGRVTGQAVSNDFYKVA